MDTSENRAEVNLSRVNWLSTIAFSDIWLGGLRLFPGNIIQPMLYVDASIRRFAVN